MLQYPMVDRIRNPNFNLELLGALYELDCDKNYQVVSLKMVKLTYKSIIEKALQANVSPQSFLEGPTDRPFIVQTIRKQKGRFFAVIPLKIDTIWETWYDLMNGCEIREYWCRGTEMCKDLYDLYNEYKTATDLNTADFIAIYTLSKAPKLIKLANIKLQKLSPE